jgi:hypothetical protein
VSIETRLTVNGVYVGEIASVSCTTSTTDGEPHTVAVWTREDA